MSKTSKLLLVTLSAAAAGVVAGLLLAPDKGSETRKKLGKTTNDLKDKMNGFIQSGKEYLQDVASTFSKEAKGMKEDAEMHFDRVKAEVN